MRIAILGFGREGKSILRFLKKNHGRDEIWILDSNNNLKTPPGVKRILGKHYLRDLAAFNLIYCSPGIPLNLPQIARIRRKGVPFSSLTKLFFELATKRTRNIIGVTGTKGKGTTSTLLYEMLKRAGKEVFLVGNIGTPALSVISKLTKDSWIVYELSSFQLQNLTQSPHIALVTETFPDHQDSHRTLREYYAAKANIVRYQKKNDFAFYFKHQAMSRAIGGKSKGRKHAVDERGFSLFRAEHLKIPGLHNFKNAVLAATVAGALDIPKTTILRAVKLFRGLEHRLEFVKKVMVRQTHHKNKSAIYFYNDSASTNPHTTAAALRAFPAIQKVLIIGGQDKNLNYTPLAKAVRYEKNLSALVLMGENRKKIARALKGTRAPLQFARNLREAVVRARRALPDGGVVLFSPGATSFDMFRDYRDRGEQFKKLVYQLTK